MTPVVSVKKAKIKVNLIVYHKNSVFTYLKFRY
jgi:hypothetical protein